MVPVASMPGVYGIAGAQPYRPLRERTSAKFTPIASTRTRTSPGPGIGSGTVRARSTSGPPCRSRTYALTATT